MSEEFQDLLRAEMERVEASPRPDLVRAAHQSQRRWQQARRRAGLAATGCVAAVAAVATVVALQPGASHPGTSAAPGSSAQTAVPAKVGPGGAGATVQTTAAPVTATFTAQIDTTAAAVLDEAARASGSGNVQLVNGWPTAPYWHTLSQTTTSSCPGQVITTNTWLGQDGTEVTGDKVAGPNSSNPTSSCYDPGTGYSPVTGVSPGVSLGGRQYSWAEFAALPTDPAKLWPILEADAKGDLDTTYYDVVTALASDPVSPAMRVALFKVMEKFPRVHVTGRYTDSLGRTGTAITFTPKPPNPPKGVTVVGGNSYTDVIDTSTGQVLAQLDAAQPVPAGCVRATVGGEKGATCAVSGADVQVFISAGPASSTPLHVTRLAMPSVVGDSVAQAERVLWRAGLNDISLKGPRAQESGTVIAQSPAAGTVVSSLTTPILTLRPGPDHTVSVTVRQMSDAAGLQQTLRNDGIPARVAFQPGYASTIPPLPAGCRQVAMSADLQGKILSLPEVSSDGVVLTLFPQAIPPGIGIYLAIDSDLHSHSHGLEVGWQLALVQATQSCTG